ncbi:putative PurR-regulated permease PerM [Streptomonospora nanhaiensis]|uniref:Putative PurR-regulated permease PerM n=1 Tax=Streptomonospora nanhaiensis TaxID=1323731 RepID=A0A853BGQ4_9ACTN|nr:putative PurR-regulated permease PerM [Streptomonospora nanhaiensis]
MAERDADDAAERPAGPERPAARGTVEAAADPEARAEAGAGPGADPGAGTGSGALPSAPGAGGRRPPALPGAVMSAAERAAGGARPGPLEGVNFFLVGFTGALGVLTAWLLVETLVRAQAVFVSFLVALFLAVGLNPVIEWLRRLGVPRWGAIVLVCAALVGFAAVFLWAIVPPLTQQVAEFIADLPEYFAEAQRNPVLADLDRRYRLLERAEGFVTSADFGRRVFGGVFGVGQAVLNTVVTGFTVLVLTLFFMASLPGITEVGYRLVPRSRRAAVRELADEILERVGAFIAGQLFIALIGGAVALAFLSVIGSGYALTLSLIVAVTALIPLVGTTIGALAATVVVGVGDLRLGVVTLAFFLVYQQIESYVIARASCSARCTWRRL